ncbi:MAG: hypothetical protein ACREPL_03765 [Rhodanobacteraceae bacterium]
MNIGSVPATFGTNARIGQLDLRVNYALAAVASNANAAAVVAALDPEHHNRVAVRAGESSGVDAATIMYQHRGDSGMTRNASATSGSGGAQVGVGVGYSW